VYTYVDLTTGKYLNVGLIERVSRFLDIPNLYSSPDPHRTEQERRLFHKDTSQEDMEILIKLAMESQAFKSSELTRDLLLAARRVEKMTRHKENPNLPKLGDRKKLLGRKLITDNLPF